MDLYCIPVGFWISLGVLAGVAVHAWSRRREAWGIPAIAAYGTVFVWYHCDVLYNDYGKYSALFSAETLDTAWLEVVIFLVSLAVLSPIVSKQLNSGSIRWSSTVVSLLNQPDMLNILQGLVVPLFTATASIWAALSVIALVRTGFDWQGLFVPWLGHIVYAWGRGKIGGGLDFIFSVVGYVNIFCLASFGVVAALAKSPRVRSAALAIIVLSWPIVIFDRARNAMIAIVLPGLLCVVFFRLRRRPLAQVGLLVTAFLVFSAWFSFVIAHRSEMAVVEAFASRDILPTKAGQHDGLNMFEELCWINKLLRDGTYTPSLGHRYFAEAVNPIPRTLWPGKPTIGLDYAMARGMGADHLGDGGVYATVATGMVGQGVVNFGTWAGPLVAALLMSGWIAMLARFDLTGNRVGRIPLYLLGIVLTFNLGRDITLLTAYPLFFGYLICWMLEKRKGGSLPTSRGLARTAVVRPQRATPPP